MNRFAAMKQDITVFNSRFEALFCWAKHVVFVGRCAAAATLSYTASLWLGLPHPLWAPMSALIISQNKLHDTRASLRGRILGTLLGVGVAVVVDGWGAWGHVDLAGQIAVAVAICAVFARGLGWARVSMWTAPIVLLTPTENASIPIVALYRGGEVVVGCLVGAAMHLLAEASIDLMRLGAYKWQNMRP